MSLSQPMIPVLNRLGQSDPDKIKLDNDNFQRILPQAELMMEAPGQSSLTGVRKSLGHMDNSMLS